MEKMVMEKDWKIGKMGMEKDKDVNPEAVIFVLNIKDIDGK